MVEKENSGEMQFGVEIPACLANKEHYTSSWQTIACSIVILANSALGNPVLSADDRTRLTPSQETIQELQRLRQQDGSQFKRHLLVCSLTERISRLCYDAGVAMGGYSITKSQPFSDRFDRINSELPKTVKELGNVVSNIPNEEATVQLLGTHAQGLLAILREARAAIDDDQVSVEQFKARHMYTDVRGAADQIAEDVENLRDENLALVSESIKEAPKPQAQPHSPEEKESSDKLQGTIQELQQLRQQDATYFDKHLQVCLLTERISRLCYDTGLALGGYSITKSPQFSERFDRINSQLPKTVSELRDVVSTIPAEETTVQLIGTHAEAVLASCREARAAFDNKLTSDAQQTIGRHAYKVAREAADQIEQDVQNLRNEDLARLDESLKMMPNPVTPANPMDTTTNTISTSSIPALTNAPVDYGPYLVVFCRQLRKAWKCVSGHDQDLVLVNLIIHRGGELSDAQVVQSSGQVDVDQAALDAIQSCGAARPLPPGAPDLFKVQVKFGSPLYYGDSANAIIIL